MKRVGADRVEGSMKTRMKGRTGLGSDLVRLTYIGGNEETVERANGPIGLVILQCSTHTRVSNMSHPHSFLHRTRRETQHTHQSLPLPRSCYKTPPPANTSHPSPPWSPNSPKSYPARSQTPDARPAFLLLSLHSHNYTPRYLQASGCWCSRAQRGMF